MEMDDTLQDLKEENRRLKAELDEKRESAEKAARVRARFAGYATSYAARVLLSRPLVDSIKAWLRATSLRNPVPIDETANVMAALLRRFIRVGLVGLMIAILPTAFLLWQSVLMLEANTQIREQNAKIQEQIEQQKADTLIVRRAQLLNTIYECEDETEGIGCLPRAHLRARQEAVLAFVEIEKNRDARADLASMILVEANLSEAILTGAILSGAILSGTNLVEANLSGANLSKADFSGAILGGTNLVEANLRGTNFSEANLSGAILTGANLSGAILTGAILSGTNLHGANLSDAILNRANLSGANLSKADFSSARLSEAILSFADLSFARLSEADLCGANLHGAKLSGAILNHAILSGAILTDLSVLGIDSNNLTQAQINSAHGGSPH